MTEKIWKATERKIASLVGGTRVPVSGRTRGDTPDISHMWLSIEVKHRRAIPGWLTEALEQAKAAMRAEQLPIAVLHKHGARHADDIVCLRLSDFIDYFGGTKPC